MSPQMKVTMNQWLITLALAAVSVFSTFQLFQYRVVQAEKLIGETQLQVDKGEDERIEMQKATSNIVHSVDKLDSTVRHYTKENGEQHLLIQASISSLGKQIEKKHDQ